MTILLADGCRVQSFFSRLLGESQVRYRKGKYGH